MFALTACSNVQPSKVLSEVAILSSSCTDFQSHMWDNLYDLAIDQQSIPRTSQLVGELEGQLRNYLEANNKEFKEADVKTYLSRFSDMYSLINEKVLSGISLNSKSDILRVLASVEIGDATSVEKKSLNAELKTALSKLKTSSEAIGLGCNVTSGNEFSSASAQQPYFEEIKAKVDPMVYGSRKVFATAYQSCEALELAPMDKSSESLRGISITGQHASGFGKLRSIASLPEVVNSHYYIKQASKAKPSCEDNRTNPLVYDFGGKPDVSSSFSSSINMFKDAGTGSSDLGIDCSGFIISAMLSAGLKLSPDKSHKAIHVHGVNSTMLKDPEDNGLQCLKKVQFSRSHNLKAGDIVSKVGHVFVVDRVGVDPFGLKNIKTLGECKNVSYKNFDFVIAHSSNAKNAVGLTRMVGKYFLETSSSFRKGMEDHALSACYEKFGKKRAVNHSSIAIVRHKMTKECRAHEVALEQQQCVSRCNAGAVDTAGVK